MRGEAGIVIAPPSLKPGKGCYEFVEGHSPYEIDLAPAPDWLVEAVRAVSKKSRELKTPAAVTAGEIGPMTRASRERKARPLFDVQLEVIRNAKEGERNDTLSRIAYTIGGLAHFIDEETLLDGIIEATNEWDEPQKTRETAERQLAEGMKEPLKIKLCVDELLHSDSDLARYAVEKGQGSDQ